MSWPARRKRDNRARWTSRPAKPIRYGPLARWSDWYNAGRDAKRELPAAVDPEPVTPTLEVLLRRARDSIEHERLRAHVDCADAQVKLATNQASLRHAMAAVARAEREFGAMPDLPSNDALARTRGGEEHTSDATVRSRRAAEHERKLAGLRAAVGTAGSELAAVESESARLRGEVEVRLEIARQRARRLHEYTCRRVAAYTRRLVRKHPDGAALNAAIGSIWPRLPDWVQHTEVPPVDVDGTDTGTSTGTTEQERSSSA